MVAGGLSEGVCVEAPCWTAPAELGVGVAPEQSGGIFSARGFFSEMRGWAIYFSVSWPPVHYPSAHARALWRSVLFVAHKATMVALKASCGKGIGWV